MPIPLVVTKRYEGQRVTVTTRYYPNRDKKLCGSTSNGTDQYQNGSSNLLTPYREQPRSTRNVVAYPRPAFSAKNRKNYVQPVLINKSKFLKATHFVQKFEIPRWWWRPVVPAVQSPVFFARSPLLVVLVGRKIGQRSFPSETSRSSL